MANYKVSDSHLLSFESLENLGVENFCSFNNMKWGNMSLVDTGVLDKYHHILTSKKIPSESVIYISSAHNDEVQILTTDNLPIYREFNKSVYSKDDFEILSLGVDSLITKLSIPIVITPADCAVLIVTGTDKKDGKRFVIFSHVGVYGTMLKLHTKSVASAEVSYAFQNSSLKAFIFPSVSKKFYIKNKTDKLRGKIFTDPAWKENVYDMGEKFAIDIEGKIIKDLGDIGITDVTITNLDTYEENRKGNLYSHTFLKENEGSPKGNFVVGCYLRVNPAST